MLQYFKCICIDDKNILNRLPKEITSVPAAIIPSMNRCLFGRDIFVWINSIRNAQSQNFNLNNTTIDTPTISNTTHNQQNPNIQQNKNKQPKGPIGYVTQEMSGISDTYAYTAVDAIPQHTYVQCNELNGNDIYTAPEKQTKINASIQPNYLKDISRKRIEQDTEIKNLYAQQKGKDAISYVNMKRQQNEQIINKIIEQQQENIVGLLSNK
jgi:hypothetical protein